MLIDLALKSLTMLLDIWWLPDMASHWAHQSFILQWRFLNGFYNDCSQYMEMVILAVIVTMYTYRSDISNCHCVTESVVRYVLDIGTGGIIYTFTKIWVRTAQYMSPLIWHCSKCNHYYSTLPYFIVLYLLNWFFL